MDSGLRQNDPRRLILDITKVYSTNINSIAFSDISWLRVCRVHLSAA